MLQAAYVASIPEVLKYGPNHISVKDKEAMDTGKQFFTYCPKPLTPPSWWTGSVYVGEHLCQSHIFMGLTVGKKY